MEEASVFLLLAEGGKREEKRKKDGYMIQIVAKELAQKREDNKDQEGN